MNAGEASRLVEQALARHKAGRVPEAEAILERVLAERPHHNAALHHLGLIAESRRDRRRALELLSRAAASGSPRPAPAAYHVAHASALGRFDLHDEALAAAQRAVALDPGSADALFTRGVALKKLSRIDEALESLEKAIALDGGHFDALNALGAILADQPLIEQRRRAVELLQSAVRLRPKNVEARCNLGNALRRLGQSADALAQYRAALDGHPQSCEAHNNLGVALQENGDLAGAIACFRQSIDIRPDYAEAHWNLGLALLQSGDMEAGWFEYEWRAAVRTDEMRDRPLPQPQWNGGPLRNRTILLRAEQGMGDTIQFIRYAAALRERGARVLLECQPKLGELMKSAAGVDRVVERGQTLPHFDTHIRLMSLPSALGAAAGAIPASVPYLAPQPQRIVHWRQQLSEFSGFKVGISWQGNPAYPGDIHRSIPLGAFEPLARIGGVRLFSLQNGIGTDQLEPARRRFGVTEFIPPLDAHNHGAFLDTAAVMANLDLIVTSDTAVAHLGGVLAAPVWVALTRHCDWRWANEGGDCPWYPTMRLFRQQTTGDWEEVFARIATELAALAGAPPPVRRLSAPTSPGELVDRITILEIKSRKIADPAKLRHVRREFEALRGVACATLPTSRDLEQLTSRLTDVNSALWEIEDELRAREAAGEFGEEFVALARAVYHTNDRRAAIKKEINQLLGSEIVDEKSYAHYAADEAGG